MILAFCQLPGRGEADLPPGKELVAEGGWLGGREVGLGLASMHIGQLGDDLPMAKVSSVLWRQV